MEIEDKVVIITGASAGIGRATAQLLTQHGAKVALVARSADDLQALAAELPGSFAVPADLSEVERIPQVIQSIAEHYGRVDGLVNNAGRAFHTPVEHADVQLYRHLLDLNLVAVMRTMQCVIPIMRQQGGGVIVNISSGLSKRIVPGVGPYAATKYALNALTLTARIELAAEHISVGLVIPGMVSNTDFHRNAVASMPRQRAGGGQPPRSDTAEEVAEKILEALKTEAAETYTRSTMPHN